MASKEVFPELSATFAGPKPGDYILGSEKSRAAARALHGARLSQSEPNRKVWRVVISPSAGGAVDLTACNCKRSLWPDGSIAEVIHLDGNRDTIGKADLDAWAASHCIEKEISR